MFKLSHSEDILVESLLASQFYVTGDGTSVIIARIGRVSSSFSSIIPIKHVYESCPPQTCTETLGLVVLQTSSRGSLVGTSCCSSFDWFDAPIRREKRRLVLRLLESIYSSCGAINYRNFLTPREDFSTHGIGGLIVGLYILSISVHS